MLYRSLTHDLMSRATGKHQQDLTPLDLAEYAGADQCGYADAGVHPGSGTLRFVLMVGSGRPAVYKKIRWLSGQRQLQVPSDLRPVPTYTLLDSAARLRFLAASHSCAKKGHWDVCDFIPWIFDSPGPGPGPEELMAFFRAMRCPFRPHRAD